MIRVLAVGALAALVLGAGLPEPGGKIEWIGAAPNLRDTDGQPPILVAAYAKNEKIAVWVLPHRQVAVARKDTRTAAWDKMGDGGMVGLLTQRSDTPVLAGQMPPLGSTVVLRSDRRGDSRVIAGPIPGQSVAIAWVAGRNCALAGICHYPGYVGPERPFSRARMSPCDLSVITEGRPPHDIASSAGMDLLADAGDGRHVFAVERINVETRTKFAITSAEVTCLTSLDLDTGDRRILAKPVLDYFLLVHKGRAIVAEAGPHPRPGSQNLPERFSIETRGRVLSVGLDGSARVVVDRDPPRRIDALVASDKGLLMIIRPSQADGSFAGNVALASIAWGSRPNALAVGRDLGEGGPSDVGFLPGGGALVVTDREWDKPSDVWFVDAERAVRAQQPDDKLASAGGPVTLNVPRFGTMSAKVVGRIPFTDLRPWMIVALQGGGRLSAAEGWSPGQALDVALVYPMQVGTRMYLYCSSHTLPPVGETSRIPGFFDSKATVLAFEPVGGVDSLKANLRW